MPSKKELMADEEIVVQVRTHGKALILPVLALLVFTAGLGVAIALLPPEWKPWGLWVVIAVYVFLIVWTVLWPFIKWRTSTYTVTNKRIITRQGVFNKTGHDLPLRRVNNVNSERSFTDRILGCGTLVLETAAGQPQTLPDVPRVFEVQNAINTLLFQDSDDDPRDEELND